MKKKSVSLRKQLRRAKELGCDVKPVRKTGEIRVSHSSKGKRVTLNRRRESAPRALIVFLNRVEEA